MEGWKRETLPYPPEIWGDTPQTLFAMMLQPGGNPPKKTSRTEMPQLGVNPTALQPLTPK